MIESDIDLVENFKTMYEEKNEDSFDQRMEGNDQIHTSLFSDKVFLNEIGTNTHALSHVLP